MLETALLRKSSSLSSPRAEKKLAQKTKSKMNNQLRKKKGSDYKPVYNIK
jgi:hypothetical protein